MFTEDLPIQGDTSLMSFIDKDDMPVKTRGKLLICIDLFIIVSTVLCILSFMYGNGEIKGTRCFRYYTILSNVYMAVSCICSLKSHIGMLKGKRVASINVELLKMSATASVTLTCLTVVFFLSWTLGFTKSFGDENLFLHLLNPVLAFSGFVFLEEKYDTGKKSFLISSVPTFIYGLLYLVMVLLIGSDRGGWPDFYGFNRGGMWPVSLVAMFAAILTISYFLYRVRKGNGLKTMEEINE